MTLHVVPRNDERQHELTDTCWCDPNIEWLDPDTGMSWASGGHKVHHASADGREFSEQVTGELVLPELSWAIMDEEGVTY